MNFLSSSVIFKGNPLLYYQGSFDPPHEGHKSALLSALKTTKAIALVIVFDDSYNETKPNRSAWHHRFKMTKGTFIDLSNVVVSDKGKEESKKP